MLAPEEECGPGGRAPGGGAPSGGGATAHSKTGGAGVPSGRVLARAALVTAALTAAGALLGLVRDQLLAHTFGAGADTDAFLVAWTVPEFASTLLIEDGMALVLVPAFSLAIARRADGASPDPVRALVRSTLPRTALAMSAGAGLVVLAAPWLVPLLAPGLPEQRLAVDCTRLTATCVLSFALAGYFSAALRAHGRFLAPAAIYVAYNTGIIAAVVLLGPGWGVRAAAVGVGVGGVLMALVQAPVLRRLLRTRGRERGREGGRHTAQQAAQHTSGVSASGVVFALVAPVVVFAVTRQAQVLVERFLAAPLAGGAISHLNYAQKIAQLPMVLSLMLCTVSFPVVARAMAAGDHATARRRTERDLLLAGLIVLTGAATVIAAAPQIVELLFQRGAFDADDTAATASVMRVYALGLLGQTVVGALVRCYFAVSRPVWYPAAAMAAGIAVTAGAGALWVGPWGAAGIALANAAGITLTAVLLLAGARRRNLPLPVRRTVGGLARLTAAAAAATAAGRLAVVWADGPLAGAVVAAAAVTAVIVAASLALRAPVVPDLVRPLASLGSLGSLSSLGSCTSLRSLRSSVGPVLRRHRHDHAPAHAAPLDRDVPLGPRRQG
ncbi:lipid II flippase MurJ [Streptomyces sp. TRM64462]|uniref:lipid II flippase MurJ n=1 Tax=Streptomyces sp. TRM64462 TaxID=2741726 RepID=UPI0015868709